MNTTRCNLIKKIVGFSQFSQNPYISIWGYFFENLKKFHWFIEELYARRNHWYVRNIKFASIIK